MPLGDSDNPQSIYISVNALRDHFAHGDYLDKCEDQSGNATNEEETTDNSVDETTENSEEEGKEIKVELEEELGVEQTN